MFCKLRQKTWLSILGGVFLPLLFSVSSSDAAVQLVYPEPSSFVTSSRHLIIKLGSNEISSVVLTINGIASDPLPVGTTEYKRAFRDFLVLQPLWDKGKNQLLIETFAGDKKLDILKTDIYYTEETERSSVPKEYVPTLLHRQSTEPLCAPCHNMRPTRKQVIDVPDRDNACYKCHKRMANQKFVHAPVSTYSCVECHSLQGSPKYSVAKKGTQLCFDCHKDKQKEFGAFKFMHGPLVAEMCDLCHDHHASENPAQLRQPVNKLCLSCHEQVGGGIHAITINDGTGHPLSGKTDPSDRGKGRELSCISCHDPHGGNARYYFVTGSDSKMDLCQMCHKK